MRLLDVLRLYAESRDIERASLKPLRCAILSFSAHVKCPATVAHMKSEIVNAWLAEEVVRVSRRTARNYRASIMTLWRWCFDERSLSDVPPLRVRLVKAPLAPVEAYTQHEIELLLAACYLLSDRFSKISVSRSVLYQALVLVSWHTGFRPGDLMRLRWSNIAGNGCVRILQAKTSAPITRWLDADTLAVLSRIRRPGVELVFGRWTCKETWREVFKSLKATAGITRGTPKWIRRAAATTTAIHHGEDAAGKVLGHKTPGLARKHYIDASQLLGEQLRLPTLKKLKHKPLPPKVG